VTTAGTFGFVTVPTAFASVSELTAGPDGALWFTESSANKIGRGDLTAAGPPAAVSLSPATGTNAAGSEHCVTATVREEIGRTTPDITVVFAAGPINTALGTSTTDLGGQTTFCYTGELVGTDQITAFADFDPVNGVRDPGEPAASAQKSWVAPSSTAECSTTNRGRMIAQNGDRVTFRGEAEAVPFGGVSGSETYSDRGPADRLVVRSTAIDAVTCDFRDGAVFGRANVGGTEQSFRIDLHDPGTTGDTYRIRLSAGYDSGVGILSSGSVTVRVGG
jgi:hypothetical protein